MNGIHLFLVCLLAATGADEHSIGTDNRPAVLMPGLGRHHHRVSTRNEQAQRFFDQGLILIFAFNHDHAVRSFRRAAELDPNLAMAQWGIAFGLGPNYNLPEVDPVQAKAGYKALQKAIALAAAAPEHERAYVEALAKRYSPDPKTDGKKLLVDYKDAMAEVARRFPDDLDAATLYAESIMNLRPWKLWGADGAPADGTLEAVALLEAVIRRNPEHPGANHYYIHAVEASLHPERALPSADRLGSLVPAAGHLVHMPAHVYFRTGDYEGAARANVQAIAVDRDFIKSTGATGIYPLMYFSHNIHFLSASRGMQGRFADSKKAADELAAHVGPHVSAMPMLEAWMATPMIVLIRFRRWDDILAAPRPEDGLPITRALSHVGRALALTAKGRLDEAQKERTDFLAARQVIPVDAVFSDNNKAHDVLAVAENVLAGCIALARKETAAAIASYRAAAEGEDKLAYVEPPDAFFRSREMLGGVLLRSGEFTEAEKVFRTDLAKQPRNGRSLFGLSESLKGQKKEAAAHSVQIEFQAAWKHADPKPLEIDDL
jgi:tetratricopeptide (TPR) repeat protein